MCVYVRVGYVYAGTYVQNAPQELFFLVSPNLLTAENPEDIKWELAPDGDHGILPPVCPCLLVIRFIRVDRSLPLLWSI
jgi:hypothetical protein